MASFIVYDSASGKILKAMSCANVSIEQVMADNTPAGYSNMVVADSSPALAEPAAYMVSDGTIVHS